MQAKVKKLWSLLLIMTLIFGINVFAQDAAADAEKKEAPTEEAEKPAEEATEEAAEEEAAEEEPEEEEQPVEVVTEGTDSKITRTYLQSELDAAGDSIREAMKEDAEATSALIKGGLTIEYKDGSVESKTVLYTVELADDKPVITGSEVVDIGLFTTNNVWMMVAAALVFLMHLGFASLESGLTRAKNTTNILVKNTSIIAIGILTFAICGFNIAYPGDGGWIVGKYFGFCGPGLQPAGDGLPGTYNAGYTYWTDFLFQAMFAATAATIVSGAVAGRIKLGSFLIFSTIYVAIFYPIVVSWKWGGGWLDAMGFYDFAGSTLVHGVGGWAALVCAFILGPRIGKYVDGKSRPIMGHSMPLAAIGVFLLWLGWFGFNGGSVLSADPDLTSFTLVTTCLASAAGIVGALATSWIVQKKPDLTMVLNGSLAGLVGITAGADSVSWIASLIIGVVAGVLVVIAVLVIDQVLKVDDPVGAISVHLICGIWGTLAVGIFGDFSVLVQLIGIVATGVFCVITSGVLFFLLKVSIGVRVHEEEEIRGLDISEHGMEAYGGFQIFSNQ